jgi:hypothetical protein
MHGLEFFRESHDPPDSIELVDWTFSRYSLRKRFHRSPESRCRCVSLLHRRSLLEGKICYRRALMLTTCRRNTSTGQKLPAQGIAKRIHKASIHIVVGVLLLGPLGCQRELDMAKTYDDRKAETTIRYIGVREGTRQYADYSSIRETILTDPAK